jgi:hypothetical protein
MGKREVSSEEDAGMRKGKIHRDLEQKEMKSGNRTKDDVLG